jgi:hypothetical protein
MVKSKKRKVAPAMKKPPNKGKNGVAEGKENGDVEMEEEWLRRETVQSSCQTTNNAASLVLQW